MIYFSSDTHFFHKNIIKYCKRPFANAEEMNAALIAIWNARVAPGDNVWHLGDFAFASADKVRKLVSQLNGNIHLIFGNHDDEAIRNLDCWASTQEYAEIDLDGQKVVMSHYAMRAWNGSHKGSLMLYGHTHNNLEPINRSIDVGVDYPAWGFGPVTLAQIRTELQRLGLDETPVYPPKPVCPRDEPIVPSGIENVRPWGDPARDLSEFYGRRIASAKMVDEMLVLTFADGAEVQIYDDGQDCCERRYMTTDDDVGSLLGAIFRKAEIKDGPDELDGKYGDIHQQQFLEISTDRGFITFVNHNENNGYYCGFTVRFKIVS